MVEAKACLNDSFISAPEQFSAGKLPSFSHADFRKADAQVNSSYSDLQSKNSSGHEDDEMGTVTPHGIRLAERAWLQYREAWVKFGAIKYPAVAADSWRAWLTQQHLQMLKEIPFPDCVSQRTIAD